MEVKGYKYKFKINISHCLSTDSDMSKQHFHTLDIVLFILRKSDDFESYDTLEYIIKKELEYLNGKFLNTVSPFDKIPPTIENIGDFVFGKLKQVTNQSGYELIRLDISETPTRVYSVNDAMTDEAIANTPKSQKLNLIYKKMAKQNELSPSGTNQTAPISLPESIIQNVSEKSVVPPNNSLAMLKKSRYSVWLKACFALLVIFIIGTALIFYLKQSGNYPLGLDLYGHLYRADYLYQNMSDGNFYPLYMDSWYNGIQPYRYWAPLTSYIVAGFQALFAGNLMSGYLGFVFFSFAAGAFGWLLWGIKENRIFLSTFLGIMWFLMPDNMRIFFTEGNLPRMGAAIILPYLFYFLWNFAVRKEKKLLFPLIISMTLMTLTHVMVAAMVGASAFIFLLFYCIINKKFKYPFYALAAMVCGIFISGIYLVPALIGGIMNTDGSGIANQLYRSFEQLIDPIHRITGNIGDPYFGISIFIIALAGVFLARKKSTPGFITVLIIFAGITTQLFPLVSKLPLADIMWIPRFVPIAYAIFILAVINWKSCKKWVTAAICIMLLLDALPSFNLDKIRSEMPADVVHSSENEVADYYALDKAKEITKQRIALMDLSSYGPFASYYLCSGDSGTDYTFGWAWQGAATGSNIVMLNSALESENFNYLFDRSIELGNDTVVISKDVLNMKRTEKTTSKLMDSARLLGYELAYQNEQSYVFHKDTPESFGVITDYKGLAVGSSAKMVAVVFPYFEEGKSDNIEDYTFEQLSRYEKIYLSNFTYSDKGRAEALIKRVTDSGTKVYIDMNRIPANKLTNRHEFMGVTAQDIVFTKQYPDIIYNGNSISTEAFKKEYSQWNTVYIDNVDETDAYCWYNNQALKAVGTKYNENAVFIGMNLFYHATETNDESVMQIIRDIFELSEDDLPQRQIVPIDIKTSSKGMTILSPYDNVNTTLAFQDNFESTDRLTDINNLLHVNNGETVIRFVYPHLKTGSAVSVFGLAASAALCATVYKKRKKRKILKTDYSK